MGETEETDSNWELVEDSWELVEDSWELVEDSRGEVIGEFQLTDIVSEYNMKNNSKPRESSVAQNHEFHIKRMKFLKDCLEKGIFLEGLITSVFMDDSSFTDVFESGIAKAANFSELGDIQTVLSAITQCCAKLHTKSGKQRSQQVAWFHKNGFKETTFKEIDKQLRDRYTEVVALVSDLNKRTILNFNKQVLHIHETMMEIMAKLWYNRLCIYQGHKDLGYVQISSKVPGLIGTKSCYRLTNEPPRFVLALDALHNDHIPEELNLLVCVKDDLAIYMLSKYHNTTQKDMVDQFFCIPVATEYMNFELGSLASSEKFCERLELICGHVIKVLYDRDIKELSVLCPKVGCDRVKSVLEKELKSLQMELETKELEIPFPNLHSPLRMQIGEGLQCMGINGFLWFRGNQLREVHIRTRASNSDSSEVAEISLTCKEDKSCTQKRNIEDLCYYQHLSDIENDVEYECHTGSVIRTQTNILVDDIVVFDSSVEVLLHCLIKDKVKDGNVLISFKDAKTNVISGVIRVFSEVGLRTDGRENSTAIWAQTNSESPNQFELKIVFPNVYAARTGVRCIESISSSNSSVCLKHPTKLATDLKRICFMMASGLYHVIEKPLQEFLCRMRKENVVESWIMHSSLSSVNCSNINLQVFMSVTATENCHMHSLAENLEDFFQPAKVIFDNLQLHYLQSNDGTKFLKFLRNFTKTCIYLPGFHKKVYIYGNHSNKSRSASILKRQLAEIPNSSGLSWYLFDFDKTCFNSHALKILYHNMRSHLDKLVCNSDISQYFLFEDRPEIWIETKAEVFRRYSEEIKSTLLQRIDVLVDRKSPRPDFMCSICFIDHLASSKDCYLLSVCEHAYCRECLLQLIIQSTKDRKLPVKCAVQKCDKALSVAELLYVCGVFQYYDIRKVLRDVLKSFVAENAASFGLCPRSRCGALCVVYEQDKTKACLWCQGRFCLQCDSKFHGTLACEEVWNTRKWLKEDGHSRKRCPNCRIAIEKEFGCDTVFCAWCKKYICWICGQFHSKTEYECYTHISNCKYRGRSVQ